MLSPIQCLLLLIFLIAYLSNNLQYLYSVVDIDSTGVELSRTTELNPSNALLECDILGHGLTYNWTCNGCGAIDTSRTLDLPKEGYTPASGSSETITCTASVGCEYWDDLEFTFLYLTLTSQKCRLSTLVLFQYSTMLRVKSFYNFNKYMKVYFKHLQTNILTINSIDHPHNLMRVLIKYFRDETT